MRPVLVVATIVLVALSGCATEEPGTQSVGDGQGTTCTASGNATAATVSCTSTASNSTTSTGATVSEAPKPAGNTSSNTTSTAPANSTGNATGNATGNQTAPPAGPAKTYSCTVTLGTAGVSVRGTVNLGACSMGTTDAPVVVAAIRAPSGCTANYDTNPDDNALTGAAKEGERYDANTEFVLSCGPGAVNAKGELDAVPA